MEFAERFGLAWKDIYGRESAPSITYEIATSLMLPVLLARPGTPCGTRVASRRGNGCLAPRAKLYPEGDADLSMLSAVTTDEKMGRKHTLCIAARTAFFENQNVQSLRKALSHRSRVKPRDYKPGDMVYIYRADPSGKKHKAKWIGPATIIGAEGSNYWAARGGRCLLAAREHLRPAEHEEVSLALRGHSSD